MSRILFGCQDKIKWNVSVTLSLDENMKTIIIIIIIIIIILIIISMHKQKVCALKFLYLKLNGNNCLKSK